jgi:hypothetical protein
MQIYSLSGARIFEQIVNANTPVNISALANGVYLIKVNNYTQKLIVK